MPDLNEAVGVAKRQRFEEDCMDDAEDGGVGADAEGHDEDGYRGEARALEQVPSGKLQIPQESRHDTTLPRLLEGASWRPFDYPANLVISEGCAEEEMTGRSK
jgi:hypothetical protein